MTSPTKMRKSNSGRMTFSIFVLGAARRTLASPFRLSFLGLVFAVCFTGCRQEKITAYRVPKESEVIPSAAQADSGDPMRIQYQTPNGWKEEAASGMSLAKFSLADNKAEFSVMSFPGEGASRLNLVNIVRENAGLAPLNDDQLSKLVETVSIGGDEGSLVDLGAGTSSPTNQSPNAVMVAVFPHAGATWFFKLIGPPEIIAAQKPALLDFLKSVSFVPGETVIPPHAPQMATESLPPVESGASSTGKPAWVVPAEWHETSPGQMLLAKFVIRDAHGETDVSVSKFPGDVGGLLANVNRWRGQVGLTTIAAEDLDKTCTTLDASEGKATLVEMSGKSPKTGQDTRLVGVIWPRNGETWFYKMMGDVAATANQKTAFLKFIQSVRY